MRRDFQSDPVLEDMICLTSHLVLGLLNLTLEPGIIGRLLQTLRIYTGSGYPDSGPQAYLASVLSTEPSSWRWSRDPFFKIKNKTNQQPEGIRCIEEQHFGFVYRREISCLSVLYSKPLTSKSQRWHINTLVTPQTAVFHPLSITDIQIFRDCQWKWMAISLGF